MAKVLEAEGVISNPRLFRIALLVDPNPKPIKAGEYEVPAHLSMAALVDLLQSGKVVQRRLTVPEGATTAGDRRAGAQDRGACRATSRSLSPKVSSCRRLYFYSRADDTRDSVLLRMRGGDGEDPRGGLAQAARRGCPMPAAAMRW